jgi:hypothetical protein
LVVVGVVVIMAFRSKFRKAEREGIMRMQNKEMDPQSPVPWHTPQQQQAYPEQQQQALQGGATLEAQTGARIDTSTPVWHGGRQ